MENWEQGTPTDMYSAAKSSAESVEPASSPGRKPVKMVRFTDAGAAILQRQRG